LLSMLAVASQDFEEVYSASGVHIFYVRGDNRRELAKLPQG
jgi:hypothetical protein